MLRVRLCTETAPCVCMFIYVCKCVWVSNRRGDEVNLECNENANCLPPVDLHCQSASQYPIAFKPLTKWPTINPDVTGTNHSTKPFPSFITDKSISLIVMCSPHVHPLFLHWFLSYLHLSELFSLHPSFQHFLSIPSRGRFCNWHQESWWNEKTIKQTGSWGWMEW